MLELLSLAGWLVRFWISFPFSWLARLFNFLALSLCGYRTVVSAGMVVHPRFGYAILVKSKLHSGGSGRWFDDIGEADAALRYQINSAVEHLVALDKTQAELDQTRVD
jgi:hypothetical protein